MNFVFFLLSIISLMSVSSCGKKVKFDHHSSENRLTPTNDEIFFKATRNLNMAMEEDDLETFKSILKNHPEIHVNYIMNVNGDTLLISAIKNDAEKIRDYLLSQGANPNKTNINHESPLWISVLYKNKKAVSKLLEYHAHLEVQDSNGDTALMLAIKTKNEDIAILLLKNGAPIDSKNKSGKTLFQFAQESKLKKIIEIIENIMNLENGKLDFHSFYKILSQGDADLLNWALNQDPSITQQESYIMINPLFVLLELEDEFHAIKLARILIDHGLDPNGPETKMPPLIEAVKRDKRHFVNFLLSQGADIEKKNKNGRTPLMIAVAENNPAMVSLLLFFSAEKKYEYFSENSKIIFDACEEARLTKKRITDLHQLQLNKIIRQTLLHCPPVIWPF